MKRVVSPQHEGSTATERTIHDVLLRQSLPGLPPEIATESTLCRARIFKSGACAVIATVGAGLFWYATSLLTHSGDPSTGIVLLIIGLAAWLTASGPGLALALLALTEASGEERPIAWLLAAINGSLFGLFFYVASHHTRV